MKIFQQALIAFIAMLIALSLPVSAQFSFFTNQAQSENNTAFKRVQEAFPFNFIQENNQVILTWEILPEYYLYRDKIVITSSEDAKIGRIIMREGVSYEDEFFGKVKIFTDSVNVTVPILEATNASTLKITFQGCAEAGFCYPPTTMSIPLSAVAPNNLSTQTSDTAQTEKKEIAEQDPLSAQREQTSAVNTTQITVSKLSENWWQPLVFFALGIGLAFTPCVLPMYPILTGIVLGGQPKTHAQTFKLAMLYIQGMALTYTLLGLVVASAGLQFQAAFQHPAVLISLSVLFVLLAASMFGAFSLQLPASLQTKLSELSNQQEGGNAMGVFAMGAISGLICSPCTTAPLSGALLYVAQSGDLLTGGVTLYALALGMGVPLLIAAMFGNKLLPQAGAWMDKVKAFFGFILLAAPLFLLERILPETVSLGLWIVWLVIISTWLFHVSRQNRVSWLSSIFAVIAILGLASATQLGFYQFIKPSEQTVPSLNFISIDSMNDLERELAAAKANNKSVLLDFYADWCVACKEIEKYTFKNPEVAAELQHMVLLKADVTANAPEDVALLNANGVFGLPTVDFWNAEGQALKNARMTGVLSAQEFLTHLKTFNIIRAERN